MRIAIQNKRDKIIYAGLFIIALAVVFSSTYNPLNFRRMHVDSSVYMTIAQGITRGQLPYRDFVDNKGPLAYLLSVPGLMLGRFTGVWVTELVLMCVSIFFAYKTALFFGSKFKALLGTVCGFVVFLAFFTVAAGTEEYSLPFLMISLYLFTKYYFSPERDIGLFELIALDICFACAVLIRLNMFPLWVGFCTVIVVESITKRRFALLGKCVFGFCLGIMIAAVPVFLYLKLNGIMADFFYQVIKGGAAQGFSASGLKQLAKNIFIVINRSYSFAPLFYGFFMLITKYKQNSFSFYLGYTFSYILMVVFLSFSSGDSHYNVALVPFFVPAFTSFVETVYAAFSGVRRRNALLVFFLCVVFSEGLFKYLDDLTEMFYNDSGTQLIKAGKTIDENTREDDKIISLGINGYIYPFNQRKAVSKYIYQGSGIDHLPGAREEFLSDVLNNKPAVIAIFSEDDLRYDYLPGWYAPVYAMIAAEYRLLSDEHGFYLFIRTASSAPEIRP
ncbi:MAG: hypothetical protein LBU18_06515 [Treponema sp.]|jgi:hypothetical protein|nr:hypothetical protein [Treponema sp.]